MTEHRFQIENIPAVLYGDAAEKAYLFVHGQCGCKEEGLAFAEIACPKGVQVLAVDLPEHGERQGEKDRFNPWTVVPELKAVFAYMKSRWSEIGVRANSIGAYFSMLAFADENIEKALFVSPIVDMERLICDMMGWAGVTEDILRRQGEISTDFGQTLSWDYLCWAREHPLRVWSHPTVILYAERDNLTTMKTIKNFADAHAASLTICDQGEHWFHTPDQLAVLRNWEETHA
ncbi:MAG: alpha/beta hydrolase [Pseudoflavonifractor sp.]|nr:alpha/beta hydrolase [Pseudoflavonifractor sp.]